MENLILKQADKANHWHLAIPLLHHHPSGLARGNGSETQLQIHLALEQALSTSPHYICIFFSQHFVHNFHNFLLDMC